MALQFLKKRILVTFVSTTVAVILKGLLGAIPLLGSLTHSNGSSFLDHHSPVAPIHCSAISSALREMGSAHC